MFSRGGVVAGTILFCATASILCFYGISSSIFFTTTTTTTPSQTIISNNGNVFVPKTPTTTTTSKLHPIPSNALVSDEANATARNKTTGTATKTVTSQIDIAHENVSVLKVPTTATATSKTILTNENVLDPETTKSTKTTPPLSFLWNIAYEKFSFLLNSSRQGYVLSNRDFCILLLVLTMSCVYAVGDAGRVGKRWISYNPYHLFFADLVLAEWQVKFLYIFYVFYIICFRVFVFQSYLDVPPSNFTNIFIHKETKQLTGGFLISLYNLSFNPFLKKRKNTK